MAPGHKKNSTAREKEAAERKLKEEVMNRDFWCVYGHQNNSSVLQDILDTLFNSIEGNDYQVQYQENQNGTRLVVVCKVCSKELTSYDPFIAHENGKLHKKLIQKTRSIPESNLGGDLQLQPHNKLRGIFPEGSLEDLIDSTHFPVLGIQFVYKEVINGTDTFTCQLCHRCAAVHQISTGRMFSHLTSAGHNQKYLETKFGYLKMSSKELEEECIRIEELEGKIHTNIVDLTIQYPLSKSSEKSHSWSQSTSLSPSSRSKIPKTETTEISGSNEEAENSLKPETCDVGVTIDMSSEARFIMHEVNALQEPDCQMILQDDDDMQDLLQETVWVLANKLEKYYKKTGATYNEGMIKTPLSVCAEKVKQYVEQFAELK